MSLSILSGCAKSHKINVPKGDVIRPTSVLLRRRVFDSVQSMQGRKFLDLCAGSGAMGFEAWSRGAQNVDMVEKASRTFKVLSENLSYFHSKFQNELTDRPINIYKNDAISWLKRTPLNYDVIFIDPPYEKHALYDECLKVLRENMYQGTLWIESDNLKGLCLTDLISRGLDEKKIFKQGDSFILISYLDL